MTTLTVGDQAPALERTMHLADMVAYAGATWDWHRLHYDSAWLEARGIPAPVVDGQMFGALIAQQLQDWCGPDARIERLRFRFKNLVYAGETVSCAATVTAVEDGVATVECRIDVLGDNARVAVAPASAEVRLR
ncbi:MaoC/PaaZ C-terminal domain-containing protein [Nocardioides sp.]|uniref:MaoC/PaaZ C-terminal domain-containing protein n=1 Tax=Nocardioides sp. TaxID=35761 RepID=UPI003569CDAB